MKKSEFDKIRKLCLKHEVKFYAKKDQNDEYTVTLYEKYTNKQYTISHYQSAYNRTNSIANSEPPGEYPFR
jgi:hypothetical protein